MTDLNDLESRFIDTFNRFRQGDDFDNNNLRNDDFEDDWDESSIEDDDEKFIEALKRGRCDVVDSMLASGYVPEPGCIYYPCRNGNLDMVTRLLSCGHPMDIREGMMTTVLNEQCHLLDHLYLHGIDINEPFEDGCTFLHYVQDGDTCKWLLDMGAKQVLDNTCCSPLYSACNNTRLEVVKMLLERGAEQLLPSDNQVSSQVSDDRLLTGKENRQETPLLAACNRNDIGSIEIVKLLLSYPQGQSSICIQNNDGNTPLHIACSTKRVELVRLLLSYSQGQDSICIQNNEGATPLHEICMNEHIGIIQMLLSYPQGSKAAQLTNNTGRTPLRLAIIYWSVEAIKLLLEQVETFQVAGKNTALDASLDTACSLGYKNVVKLLLTHPSFPPMICLSDKRGYTPVHIVCKKGFLEIVELLLQYPQYVTEALTMKTTQGKTPIEMSPNPEFKEAFRNLLP